MEKQIQGWFDCERNGVQEVSGGSEMRGSSLVFTLQPRSTEEMMTQVLSAGDCEDSS